MKQTLSILLLLACAYVQVWGEELPAAPLPFDPAYNTVLIQVTNPHNIYKVSGSDLSGAGIDISGYPADRIGILYEGTEIPIIVSDGGDNSIGLSDYILFAGEPYKDSYTNVNVYVLGVLNQTGLRMGTADYTPSGGTDRTALGFERDFVFESDLRYSSLLPEIAEADHWYWNSLYKTDEWEDYTVDLGSVFTDAGSTCSITVYVTGITSNGAFNPDHHVVVYVNGNQIGDFYFDGRTSVSQGFTFAQDILVTGNNTIRIEVPQDTGAPDDSVFVDRFEVKAVSQFEAHNDLIITGLTQAGIYTVSGFSSDTILLFDITGAPAVVTGYTVSSGSATLETAGPITLLGVENGALGSADGFHEVSSAQPDSISECDYIVITAPDLISAASGLSSIHPDLSVSVFDAYYIYTHFGTGRISPYPIRDFLSYCYSQWNRPPRYAVLVGDCANNRTGVIPPYYIYDSLSGVIPADNWFACVSGTDAVPDISCGRIPADTETEVNNYINKIDAYLTLAPQGQWERNMIYVADNSEGVPEDSIFPQYNGELADLIPPGYSHNMINLEDYFPDVNSCTNAIINSINQGALVTEYLGHGGIWTWAGEMIFADSDLIGRTDARGLFNADSMFPFFISIACLDGSFIESNEAWNMSLSERLILNPVGGAIGVFSATGFADAEDKFLLARELYRSLFDRDIRIVGDALKRAKEEYTAAHQDQQDLILHTHNLMGDPALELRIPSPYKPFDVKAEYYDKGELSEFSPVHKDVEHAVALTWKARDNDIAFFEIFRSCEGGPFSLKARVAGKIWYDMSISRDREYAYYIVTVNTRGIDSADSDTVCVRTEGDNGIFGCALSESYTGFGSLFVLIVMCFILRVVLIRSKV